MSDLVHDLAYKAGIVRDEDFTLCMESIGGRGYLANREELGEFARLVGELARESERKRLQSSDKSLS